MNEQDQNTQFDHMQKRIIELAIKLGTLFILFFWCFRLVEPFVLVIAWGVIVAIALFPVFSGLSNLLGGRQKTASALLTITLIATLIVPSVLLTDSMINGAQTLADAGNSGELTIPPPNEIVRSWPLIGEQTYNLWLRGTRDLPNLLKEYTPQIKTLGTWGLTVVTGTGLGLLQFIVSFMLAGILLTNAPKGEQATRALAARLAGTRGTEFAQLTVGTIRNVALGIVGVSILQTALLSLGFLAIGLPGAGFLGLIVLILCIVQIGPSLIAIPAIIYVFSTVDPLPATIFAIWTMVMMLIDNVLKPLVFSRGASVPTLVIFLGAIGGMIAYGIIGLFLGAVILSLGYKLYAAWLADAELQITQSAETPSETAE